MTLIELMAALSVMSLALAGALTVLLQGLRSFQRIQADLTVSQPSAQAMRRISDTLRGAMSVSITNSGRTINYTLPVYLSTNDPVTGEREVRFPLQSDGVARSFSVSNGRLYAYPGGRVLAPNVQTTDPLSTSSQYNQAYAPFQSTTIGSRRAITVTLITLESAGGKNRFARMKSTVLIQNSR